MSLLLSPMRARRSALLKASRANAGQLNPLDALETDFTVTLRDHDVLGHFTNIRYNQLAELCREAWFIQTGIEAALAGTRQTLKIIGEDMAFLKMMRSGMHFEMVTKLAYWDERVLVFTHDSRTPKRQTGSGFCVMRLSDGEASAQDLLARCGADTPSPAPDHRFKGLLTSAVDPANTATE